jgi:hypothetical protein
MDAEALEFRAILNWVWLWLVWPSQQECFDENVDLELEKLGVLSSLSM